MRCDTHSESTQTASAEPSIWVVDDEPHFRQFVRTVAEHKAWTVQEFATGAELISGLDRMKAPHLIVLDMVMPAMDGIESILKIPEYSKEVRILIASGKDLVYGSIAEHLGEKDDLQVLGTVPKPVSIDELQAYLDMVKFQIEFPQ